MSQIVNAGKVPGALRQIAKAFKLHRHYQICVFEGYTIGKHEEKPQGENFPRC